MFKFLLCSLVCAFLLAGCDSPQKTIGHAPKPSKLVLVFVDLSESMLTPNGTATFDFVPVLQNHFWQKDWENTRYAIIPVHDAALGNYAVNYVNFNPPSLDVEDLTPIELEEETNAHAGVLSAYKRQFILNLTEKLTAAPRNSGTTPLLQGVIPLVISECQNQLDNVVEVYLVSDLVEYSATRKITKPFANVQQAQKAAKMDIQAVLSMYSLDSSTQFTAPVNVQYILPNSPLNQSNSHPFLHQYWSYIFSTRLGATSFKQIAY